MPKAMLEMVGVHKSFGRQKVLSGLNLVVPEGMTYVVLGVSGSGKTILIKHFVRLLQPDRGIVRVEGKDFSSLTPSELDVVRRELGVLFQGGALLDSLTVYENLELPLLETLHMKAAQARARIRETLELVELRGIENKLPADLSGGMRKRVAFARAVVHQPTIVLYDEPTAGLDPLTTESVTDVILSGKERLGVTALVITHDLASAFRVADRIALLHEGRMVGEAPPDEFKASRHPAVQAFLKYWFEREKLARAV
jgi:phospholipid/cholesterol/gamma-HCH transport system ATP-binding protein